MAGRMVDVLAVKPTSLTDPSAFRVFYDEVLPRVYSYFFHRCGGERGVAEDLTQETFVAAVAELRKQRPIADPVHWIFGIARHKLVDHYRKVERDERRNARAGLGADQDFWHTAEERELTARVLAALPVAQRAALVLRYLDDLPVAEVAHVLGRSLHATESLIARGKEGFRRMYVEVDS
jgi:RNA polymerase sigma-70 factor (ECF subfamily)